MKLIVVFGLPGSGKSYLASRLSEKLGYGYLSSDIIRRDMLDNQTYSENERFIVYERMKEEAEDILKDDKSVVLDATFYREKLRDLPAEIAEESESELYFIEIQAGEETHRTRLAEHRNFSEADFSVYQKLKETFEPMREKHLILKSDKLSIDEMIKQSLSYIGPDDSSRNK